MAYIYVVEDDNNISEIESFALKNAGHTVIECACGKDFHKLMRERIPDLVLLDIMLPDEDGLEILKKLRQVPETRRVPVIMVTAKTTEIDKVKGLDMGADDYINKPFRPRELVSRIRSVLRRTGKSQKLLKEGSITVDTVKGIVYRNGEELALSALEYRLLLIFFNNKGVVLSRGRLLSEIWDVAGEFVNDNTLTVYIKRLREKIEEDPSHPELIKTVRGMGYRL